MNVTLRPFQSTAVTKIRGAYMAGQRRVLFVMATGLGKTYTFVYIAEQAAIRGNRICILVHRQELVDQASRSLHSIGCQHGIIASGYDQDLSHAVQVASVQTLARRLHTIPEGFFQLLIVDEAHHAVAGTWATILTAMPRTHILGVTATPERLDGRGLDDQFEHMIIGPDAGWGTANGFLVPARIFAPPGIDLSGIKRFDTRKGHDQAEQRLKQGQAMGDAVTHYRRTIEGVYNGTAIAFCVSVAHAEAVAEAFRNQGISAAMLDGNTDRGVRKRLINDLGAGTLKVLTSCDIVSEGTDIPSVTGAILLRPTDSLGLHLQQVGRVLRPCPGKPYAVVNDHVGNTLRHGLPTDPRDWSLEGRPKGKGRKPSDALPVRVCPACFSALPSVLLTCSQCGHTITAGKKELVTIDGKLVEVSKAFNPGDIIQAIPPLNPGIGYLVIGELDGIWTIENVETKRRAALHWHEVHHFKVVKSAKDQKERREVARARTREELEAVARERGYKPGWVTHMLAARGQHHGRAFG